MSKKTKALTSAIMAAAGIFAAVPAQGQAVVVTSPVVQTTVGVYATAHRYIGKPYCHGGSGPKCFDCSGFTKYIYSKKGIKIPSTASGQYRKAKKVSRKAARPGDLVFFFSGNHIYHVGIYAGHGKVLHCPKPGERVRIERIWTTHVKFGRI